MVRFVVALLLAAAPPALAQTTMPGMENSPNVSPQLSAPPPPQIVVPDRGGPGVLIPQGQPGRNNFSDRIQNCIHAGSAAGVGPNDMGQFSARCAN
jgi:hypothetical protein